MISSRNFTVYKNICRRLASLPKDKGLSLYLLQAADNLLKSQFANSHDSGISVGTNSNDSSTGSGDELVKPKEKSSNGIYILPFSPLKERTISEVAVPMFPNHKGSVKFSPPVRMFHRRPHFECGEKMDELLSKLPDYAQFQSEIVRNIYVTPQAPKRQFNQIATKNDHAKSISEMGEILKNKC